MDFTKIQNEFMNLQAKIESSNKIVKGINDYIKVLNRDVAKLKNKNEKDEMQKQINTFIIGLKESVINSLTNIIEEKEN